MRKCSNTKRLSSCPDAVCVLQWIRTCYVQAMRNRNSYGADQYSSEDWNHVVVLSVNINNMHSVCLFIYNTGLARPRIHCLWMFRSRLDQNNIPVISSCDIVTKLLVFEEHGKYGRITCSDSGYQLHKKVVPKTTYITFHAQQVQLGHKLLKHPTKFH